MYGAIRFAVLVIATLFIAPMAATAASLSVGDVVVLHATNPAGVPLHREPNPSLFGRAPDGATATVRELANEGRWLRIELPGGTGGWVVARYLERQSAPPLPPPAPTADVNKVFGSLQECEQVVAAGGRLGKAGDRLRIATWNIRWFPDGNPQKPGMETDLRWLACALAWLNPDVMALSEIRSTRKADAAWAAVTDGISGHIGGDWRVDLQGCGGELTQHVGFLWNAERVTLSDAADVWQMNGAASNPRQPCAGNLRPGRASYVKSRAGGIDLHIVAVHWDSGTRPRDFAHRESARDRLDSLFTDLNQRRPDADLIVLGDFNTMGVEGGVNGAQEIAVFRSSLATEVPGFRALMPKLECSEYFEGRCGLLDHIVVTRDMVEAGTAAAIVSGYCAMLDGQPFGDAEPVAYQKLSDHCPVFVDIEDRDRD